MTAAGYLAWFRARLAEKIASRAAADLAPVMVTTAPTKLYYTRNLALGRERASGYSPHQAGVRCILISRRPGGVGLFEAVGESGSSRFFVAPMASVTETGETATRSRGRKLDPRWPARRAISIRRASSSGLCLSSCAGGSPSGFPAVGQSTRPGHTLARMAEAGEDGALEVLAAWIQRGPLGPPAEVEPGVWAWYSVKCDDCKSEIGQTGSIAVSSAGGRCAACKGAIPARDLATGTTRPAYSVIAADDSSLAILGIRAALATGWNAGTLH